MPDCHECRCSIAPPCSGCTTCDVCNPCTACDEVHDGPRGDNCTALAPSTGRHSLTTERRFNRASLRNGTVIWDDLMGRGFVRVTACGPYEQVVDDA